MNAPQQPAHTTQVCYRHPDRPTLLSCSRCGRSACPECLEPAAVGQHCVECRRGDGTQRAAPAAVGAQTISSPAVARRSPIGTYALIAVNVVIFALCVIQAKSFDAGLAPLFQHGDLVRAYVADGEYWRLLTAGFLHFTVAHIALNMISLYILGRDLEAALGLGRYLMVYFIALFGGSAAVMLFEAANVRSAGASGAIYGLMGAVLVVVLKAKVSPTGVITIIVINLVFSVTMPGISLAAHVGGLVFGAAATAAIIYLPGVVLSRESRTQQNASRVGWIALVVLLVIAIGLGVAAGSSVSGLV
ncbi:rhomboid family intramembrane serine protease [Gordonia otitidis]|nr:rhomboid family intramembrane serine protease [Gordonia otitidis]